MSVVVISLHFKNKTHSHLHLITFELELKILCYIQKINKIPKTENKQQQQQ
jgi:hypothetical protein